MNTSTGLGQIAENIAAAFNDRMMSIDELVKETSNMRKGFREEQHQVVADLKSNAAELKTNLANGENVRLGDFKDMMVGIDSSIDSIQKAVVTLTSETQTMMADIQKDHKQMADELKANLANGEDVRLGDFKNMMAGIDSSIDSIQKAVVTLTSETQTMMADIQKDHHKMAADLKANLANGEDVRHGDFKNMMTGINNNIDSIQKAVVALASETQTLMADIQKDHHKMADELKANLANGEDVRLGDFKNMMTGIESSIKTIQERRKEISTEVAGLMKVFGTEREQSAAEWNALIGSIRGGGGKSAVLKKAKVVEKTVKRPEIQAEVVKPKPVPEKAEVVKPKPVPEKIEVVMAKPVPEKVEVPKIKPAPAKTVEEKILAYIASHPKEGVKVGEMEKPLGVNKMKLGKVSKKLLKQGKLRKEDNKYFPK